MVIQMVDYKPSRDLPAWAREQQTLSWTKLAGMVLDKRNEKVSPDSIEKWFKRHPEVYEDIKEELVGNLPTEKEVVTDSMFANGNFENVRTVKEFKFYMETKRGHKGKPLHPNYIKQVIMILKQVCQQFQKHPDRLTLRDAQEIFLALEKDSNFEHWDGNKKVAGKDSSTYRKVLKAFLKANSVQGWEKIGVGKPSGYGHYKQISAEHETVKRMIDWITEQNFEVGTIDWLMYVTGLRIGTTPGVPHGIYGCQVEDFKRGDQWDYMTVGEKFREVYTFDVVKEVGNMIAKVIGERKTGAVFNIDRKIVCELNREGLKKFLPELEPSIMMPNHVFRHFCAQRCKKLTNGNSAFCAEQMHCSKQSFDESYGGITSREIEEGKKKYVPLLGA